MVLEPESNWRINHLSLNNILCTNPAHSPSNNPLSELYRQIFLWIIGCDSTMPIHDTDNGSLLTGAKPLSQGRSARRGHQSKIVVG